MSDWADFVGGFDPFLTAATFLAVSTTALGIWLLGR